MTISELNIDKPTVSDTNYVYFTTGLSARSWIGTSGNDFTQIQVSPDGTTWYQALTINNTTGSVTFPNTSIGGGSGGGSGSWTTTNIDSVPGQALTNSNQYIQIPCFSTSDSSPHGDYQFGLADGGPYGTQKTLSGNPTATTTANNATITLSSGHPFVNGDYVTITGVPHQGILSGVGSTSATITPAPTTSVSTATINYIWYDDPLGYWGYNFNGNNSSEPEFIQAMESKYLAENGYVTCEWYCQFMPTSGSAYLNRPLYLQYNRDINDVVSFVLDCGNTGTLYIGDPFYRGLSVATFSNTAASIYPSTTFYNGITCEGELSVQRNTNSLNTLVLTNNVSGSQAAAGINFINDGANNATVAFNTSGTGSGSGFPNSLIFQNFAAGGVVFSAYSSGATIQFYTGTQVATAALTLSGNNVNTTGVYQVGGTQVVSTRITGYGTPTGGSHQSSFAAGSITLANLAAAVAQLIVDLKTHGLLGA